ncbi:hypothetical protein EO98_14400 [Methanosarcina sp. 2.H.T.1A.6]|uniref:hypothetical protein n=1 Tax=unclassified Methanosarcina TaxID=2644672 RepID=UPI0006221445|nr:MULTISPECIES: hypothetical protein [unclassified Methanosarcina]KKG18122.1 hypothetical protein EO94_06235 [Methanosarcina sp. 2.H.T.1A.3]KKG20071.1 hypothetical protein EO98_14400 [Methanosarcina sp. 2.H.T.1A.6]KKG22735.1 hypothetical protein EO96_12855 [Methanosarcina sp. 2.H.T.1A.8]KKG25484.1 hypothetical protein EO97_13530 [Methanosarcina sp. 2.H.T.1A.15]
MTMEKKFVLSVPLAAMMLMSMAFVPAVSAQEVIEQKLTFGPETLNELKSNPNFIAAYGNMPAFSTSEERKKWLDILDLIYTEVNIEVNANEREMSKYFYPDGPIINYGFTNMRVLKVEVNKEIEKSFMDEIYQIFDSHASRIGVNEVPLVFFRGDVSALTELSDTADLNETENNTNQQTKSGSETSKEKPNSIPGFSLMYGLFGLYLVCRIRH